MLRKFLGRWHKNGKPPSRRIAALKNETWTLLKQAESKELYKWEMRDEVSNERTILYRGKTFLYVDGERKQAMSEPIFKSLELASAWFDKE